MEQNETQVQVKFFTKEKKYSVPDAPFSVPTEIDVGGLSSLINGLLKEADDEKQEDVEFEFLIDGEILRSSLALLIDERGISLEDVLSIEYHPRCPAPQPHHSLLHDDWVSSVQARDQWILSGCYDSTLHLWTVKGEHKLTMPGHTGPVKAVSWMLEPKEQRLLFVSGGHDESVLFWEWDPIENSIESCVIGRGHTRSVECVAVDPSDSCVASGGWDNDILLWNPTDVNSVKKRQKVDRDSDAQKTFSPIKTLKKHNQAVSALCWMDGGDLVSVSWDHSICLWDVELGGMKDSLRGNKPFFDADWSPLNRLLITASADRHLRLYDLRSKEGNLVKSTFTSHHGWVNCAKWSQVNDKLFISGGQDKIMKMWDIRSPKTCLYNMACQESVLCCDWSVPRYVISGGRNNAISIYQAGDSDSPSFKLS